MSHHPSLLAAVAAFDVFLQVMAHYGGNTPQAAYNTQHYGFAGCRLVVGLKPHLAAWVAAPVGCAAHLCEHVLRALVQFCVLLLERHRRRRPCFKLRPCLKLSSGWPWCVLVLVWTCEGLITMLWAVGGWFCSLN